MGFVKSSAVAGLWLLCASLAVVLLLPYQSSQAVDEILNVLSRGPSYNRAVSVLHGTNEPVTTEITAPTDLPVLSGKIPPDVDGAFVRIGPNELIGHHHGRMTYHLFDGHGFVHVVTVNGPRQTASYARSWLRTPRFVIEREKGRDVFGRIGTLFMPYLPLRLLTQAVKAWHFGLNPLTRGSANTDTRLIDGRLYALNEASLPFEFALKPTATAAAAGTNDVAYSIESVGYQNFDGKLDAPVTAHPRHDPRKGSTVFASYSPSESAFPVGEIENGDLVSLRRVPGRHPGKIGWAHDAALTENYVVIPDGGTLLDPQSIVKRGVFFDLIGTLGFTVVPRRGDRNGTAAADSSEAAAAAGEPFAVTSDLSETIVHIATAWETDDSIVVAAPTSATLRGIPVNEDTLKYEHFQFAKLTLPKGPGDLKIERINHPDCSSEFPRVNPLLDGLGRRVRYAFASCIAKPDDRRVGPINFSGWAKFDLETMTVASHVALPDGWMIGELVPIPKKRGDGGPGGREGGGDGSDGSDEVWLAGITSHVETRESRVVLYDGESGSSEPVVVLGVPDERIPSGFHGQFYSREELDGQAHFSTARGSPATLLHVRSTLAEAKRAMVSHALLNFDFYDKQDQLPFKRARVYRVEHVADENMSFFWCARKIEDVTDDVPYDEKPEAFRKWQEGSRVARSVSF